MPLFDLHQTRAKPEWDYLQPHEYNLWQRFAAATNSIITPANAISLLGGLITVSGLLMLTEEVNWLGITFILLGRSADITDGWIAHKTGTKSPLGETIDATIDKIVTLIAFICFLVGDLAPVWLLFVIAIQNVSTIIMSVLARSRHKALHPSRSGKWSMALGWALLIAFPLSMLYDIDSTYKSLLHVLGVVYAVSAAWASWGYFKNIRNS